MLHQLVEVPWDFQLVGGWLVDPETWKPENAPWRKGKTATNYECFWVPY